MGWTLTHTAHSVQGLFRVISQPPAWPCCLLPCRKGRQALFFPCPQPGMTYFSHDVRQQCPWLCVVAQIQGAG